MHATTTLMRTMLLFVAGAILLTSPAVAAGEEENPTKMTDPVFASISELVEPAATGTICEPAQITRPAWIEELHRERAAGNEAACRKLEMTAWEPQTTGEAACGTTVIPSTTQWGTGDRKQQESGDLVITKNATPAGPTFGNDVKVRVLNYDTAEYHIDMASDSNGNLYVVWEDDKEDTTYLQAYWSSDGGQTWEGLGYVYDPMKNLHSPSIAVGEDANGEGVVLLAYIVEDVGGVDYPEVATCPLPPAPWYFTIHSVPIYTGWEEYRNPVIITDSYRYKPWYAYLTCEGIYESAAYNVNVVTWRCIDGGATWIDRIVAFGNTDDYYWRAPDISFGTTVGKVFLVAFNEDTLSLYTRSSNTFGASWNTEVFFASMSSMPSNGLVDPQIAASVSYDNVMICLTRHSYIYNNSMAIAYGYSMDAGDTWSLLYTMGECSDFNEYGSALTMCEGGGSWHLAWTSGGENTVMYTCRPQDLSTGWQTPLAITDLCTVSAYTSLRKKGIACKWDTDVACVAWSDFRENGTPDYDCYADTGDKTGLMMDRTGIDQDVGGTVNFKLNAGAGNAGRYYAMFGSATGWDPGTPLPGGYAVLPINWDAFTDFALGNANVCPLFLDFIGQLNGEGKAGAQLNCPPISGFAGLRLYFSFAMNNPFDFASNPVKVRIL